MASEWMSADGMAHVINGDAADMLRATQNATIWLIVAFVFVLSVTRSAGGDKIGHRIIPAVTVFREVVTLNYQMPVVFGGIPSTNALDSTKVACVVVPFVDRKPNVIPLYAAMASFVVTAASTVGRIVFAFHPLFVREFKAASAAVFRNSLWPRGEGLSALWPHPQFLDDHIRCREESPSLAISTTFMATKATSIFGWMKHGSAYFTSDIGQRSLRNRLFPVWVATNTSTRLALTSL